MTRSLARPAPVGTRLPARPHILITCPTIDEVVSALDDHRACGWVFAGAKRQANGSIDLSFHGGLPTSE